jgi:hypothetical protein
VRNPAPLQPERLFSSGALRNEEEFGQYRFRKLEFESQRRERECVPAIHHLARGDWWQIENDPAIYCLLLSPTQIFIAPRENLVQFLNDPLL